MQARAFLLLCLLPALSGCFGPGGAHAPAPPRVQDPSGIRFADVAPRLGLTYRYSPNGTSPLNILQLTSGAGAAFLDYDSDGWPDVLCINWPHPALFRNEGGKGFTDVTEKAGLRCPEARWSG